MGTDYTQAIKGVRACGGEINNYLNVFFFRLRKYIAQVYGFLYG